MKNSTIEIYSDISCSLLEFSLVMKILKNNTR